jgi:hypothetical protein
MGNARAKPRDSVKFRVFEPQKPLAEQTNRSVSTCHSKLSHFRWVQYLDFFCAMSNMLSHFTHAIVTKYCPLGICCSMRFWDSAGTCNQCA